jgi:hypothetical protein
MKESNVKRLLELNCSMRMPVIVNCKQEAIGFELTFPRFSESDLLVGIQVSERGLCILNVVFGDPPLLLWRFQLLYHVTFVY